MFNRLKKQLHRDIALLQDEVVELVYSIELNAVLHGGTAIWRCYSGNRFSEDLDFFIPKNEKFEESFKEAIKSRQLLLLKFKQTQNNIFSKISNGEIEVRFEAAFRKARQFEPKSFEKIDGTFMDVFTLSPESLLVEKIEAFKNRMLIRDFYDIYFLSGIVSLNDGLEKSLNELVKKNISPVDEKSLKALVFSGAIPSFKQMLESIKKRLKQ